MSSTTTNFTKSFPKQADITGSPEQAFHMLNNRDKYYKYLLGGISAGTIVALGTIALVVVSNTSTRPRSTMILEESQSVSLTPCPIR
jgi:hypothetical protein